MVRAEEAETLPRLVLDAGIIADLRYIFTGRFDDAALARAAESAATLPAPSALLGEYDIDRLRLGGASGHLRGRLVRPSLARRSFPRCIGRMKLVKSASRTGGCFRKARGPIREDPEPEPGKRPVGAGPSLGGKSEAACLQQAAFHFAGVRARSATIMTISPGELQPRRQHLQPPLHRLAGELPRRAAQRQDQPPAVARQGRRARAPRSPTPTASPRAASPGRAPPPRPPARATAARRSARPPRPARPPCSG